MTIEMRSINSSNISAAGYDEATNVLDVEFITGARYSYDDVPKNVAEGFFQSPSAGQYFHNFIKNRYRYYRV